MCLIQQQMLELLPSILFCFCWSYKEIAHEVKVLIFGSMMFHKEEHLFVFWGSVVGKESLLIRLCTFHMLRMFFPSDLTGIYHFPAADTSEDLTSWSFTFTLHVFKWNCTDPFIFHRGWGSSFKMLNSWISNRYWYQSVHAWKKA